MDNNSPCETEQPEVSFGCWETGCSGDFQGGVTQGWNMGSGHVVEWKRRERVTCAPEWWNP